MKNTFLLKLSGVLLNTGLVVGDFIAGEYGWATIWAFILVIQLFIHMSIRYKKRKSSW